MPGGCIGVRVYEAVLVVRHRRHGVPLREMLMGAWVLHVWPVRNEGRFVAKHVTDLVSRRSTRTWTTTAWWQWTQMRSFSLYTHE